MADPVQRARNRKRRQLWIARLDRAVGDAIGDIVAEGAINLPLGGVDDPAIVLGEVADVEADQALAVVGGHYLGIAHDQLAQFGEAGAAAGGDLGYAVVDAFVADRPAFEQDLVLAAEVVVERRLGDVEPLGDVVERGAVIALLEEELYGRAQYRLALLVAGAAPAFERQPWRLMAGGGRMSVHVREVCRIDSIVTVRILPMGKK